MFSRCVKSTGILESRHFYKADGLNGYLLDLNKKQQQNYVVPRTYKYLVQFKLCLVMRLTFRLRKYWVQGADRGSPVMKIIFERNSD